MNSKIFISVGTHSKGFERLVKKLDEIAENEKNGLEFFAQTGNTKFEPKNFSFERFLSPKEMNEKIDWAELILCHGGAGIIGPSILKGKKIIVAPRLKEFNEHTDSHQLELGKGIQEKYGIPCITDFDKLEKEIKKELMKKAMKRKRENKMEELVKEFIEKGIKTKTTK
ncbi:MAG: glycosyltransferase [Candidatus Diapherotrites archaeon]